MNPEQILKEKLNQLENLFQVSEAAMTNGPTRDAIRSSYMALRQFITETLSPKTIPANEPPKQ